MFSTPVWHNATILAVGANLSTGKRKVTAALKVMGLKDEKKFTNYHRVLNRAKWNILNASKILLGLLIVLIPASMPLIILVDETIERRKGKKIKAKGCYRDSVRSSQKKVVRCFGLKWICMSALIFLPCSERPWALPFLTVLATSKAANKEKGKRYKTTVDWTCQMIIQVRRWLPSMPIVLVGDGAYAAVKLVRCCMGFANPVCLISRLRLVAGLFDFAPAEKPGRRGPKPKKGNKQDTLENESKTRLRNGPQSVLNGMTASRKIYNFFPAFLCGIPQVIRLYRSNGLWFGILKVDCAPKLFFQPIST